MMVRVFILTLLAMGLVACGRGPNAVPFDGYYFRATAKHIERSARETFELTVRGASRSEEGAREAAVHEASRYCIQWVGLSDVAWDVAPEDAPIENDRLIARGTCTG